MLTVDEAARVLRIGRTLAYRLSSGFLAGDDHGLRVVRLGGCLRVPRWALVEFIHHGRVLGDLRGVVTAAVDVVVEHPDPTPQARPVAVACASCRRRSASFPSRSSPEALAEVATPATYPSIDRQVPGEAGVLCCG